MIDLKEIHKGDIETKLFIDSFLSYFNEGDYSRIANIEPVFFEGASGGEYFIYDAQKLYVALKMNFFTVDVGADIANASIVLYDELNAIYSYRMLNYNCYDSVANTLRNSKGNIKMKNAWFSRLNDVRLQHFVFNGYRITLE